MNFSQIKKKWLNEQLMKTKTLLIIEDEQMILDNMSELLKLANYNIITAKNGKDGISMAKAECPDLIISDISMPELDGLSVLRILSKDPKTAGIPFIFLTGKSEANDLRVGMNLGADDYITKPFREQDLLDVIRIRLERLELIKGAIDTSQSKVEQLKDLDSLKKLAGEKKEKNYAKKEHIYREEDTANYIYFVQSGRVKGIKTDSYGKDYVTEIYKKGDFFGHLSMFDQPEYHETAIAMEPTVLSLIPRAEFIALIRRNRDLSERYIEHLSQLLRSKENRLLQLAYAPVRERVADALLQYVSPLREEKKKGLSATISREDLASIVGTTKESLVRMLSEFKREGLIRSEGREIIIMDEPKLRKTAIGF
jgi:CRP-like cAMP-binding protein